MKQPSDSTGRPAVPPAAPALRRLGDGRLLARAPAKLNLSLRVVGLRADGYHELDSLVARVTLYDELILGPREDGDVQLTCDDPAAGAPGENLALRAARLLQPHARGQGADIVLHKRIAVGAGLGGGSSDAAATLKALNELWGCTLGAEALAAVALELGSDVPLFLGPPAARMTGRGERLEPVALPAFWALILTPPLRCPTAEVYRAYDAMAHPRCPDRPVEPAELAQMPPGRWAALLANDLRPAAERVCPGLADWSRRLAATGEPVRLTGSGAALFVLADDAEAAGGLLARLDAEAAARSRIVSLNPW